MQHRPWPPVLNMPCRLLMIGLPPTCSSSVPSALIETSNRLIDAPSKKAMGNAKMKLGAYRMAASAVAINKPPMSAAPRRGQPLNDAPDEHERREHAERHGQQEHRQTGLGQVEVLLDRRHVRAPRRRTGCRGRQTARGWTSGRGRAIRSGHWWKEQVRRCCSWLHQRLSRRATQARHRKNVATKLGSLRSASGARVTLD